jgi:hypothetical protein
MVFWHCTGDGLLGMEVTDLSSNDFFVVLDTLEWKPRSGSSIQHRKIIVGNSKLNRWTYFTFPPAVKMHFHLTKQFIFHFLYFLYFAWKSKVNFKFKLNNLALKVFYIKVKLIFALYIRELFQNGLGRWL